MEKQKKIFESRKRLDTALSLPDLVNEDSIASMIKEKLIQSSLSNSRGDVAKIVESRTKEVANFLEMLRSASGSGSSHLKFSKDWKVKQDTDQLRVMYCEGPHGSPFHTLLAEGFADGPLDVCLCVSWELTLYKKWWPQYNVPTFKIIASSCLEKVRIGEEISLIRMKVPWPVSDREAVLHYFEIEYFKEDLILVLIKTLSDTDIDADTHGFKSDVIPQAKDTIRIDLVGGFVLQKVETNRCYFRAIFNFDIKLDFIPPSLINFISRQLIGNGHKLYQKAVGSVAATDVDYREALQGPLYDLIRCQLHSHNKPATSLEDFDEEIFKGQKTDAISKNHIMKARTSVPEIIEEDTEQRRPDADVNNIIANVSSENLVLDEHWASSKEKASISPEVEHALGILDQAITIIQGKNCCKSTMGDDLSFSGLLAKASLNKNGDVPENVDKLKLANKHEGSPPTDDHRHSNLSSSILEAAHNEAETLSLQKEVSSASVSSQLVQSKIIHPSKACVKVTQPLALDIHSISKVCDEDSVKAIGFYNSRRPFSCKNKTKKAKKTGKNRFLFCLSPSFFQD